MFSLSMVLLECQQPQKAIIFLRALVLFDKKNEKYIYALAWAHLQAKQPENALRVLRLVPAKSENALPHLLSAQALAKLKRFKEAKEAFSMFVEKKQNNNDVPSYTPLDEN